MSSGTTGAPKAILVEHHSFMHNIRARNAVCPYDSNPTVDIEACNVFFVWEALRAPTYGRSTLVVPNDVVVDGKQLLRFLVDYRATRFMVTPSLLRNLLDQPRLDFARFVGSQLRYVLLEGELVPTTLVADFTSAFATSRTTLVNYYSTWESLDVACTTLFDPARKNRTKMWLRALPPGSAFAPVGRPLPWVCFLVRDKAFGHIVPRGVPGTIHVVAKSVA
jgi:non-ribosomal peptide synthetase component F